MRASTTKTIIELENVSIRRGQKQVLSGVTLTTLSGQHWFIMGANGSGKTTLMEIVLGYLWPQEGRVTLLGETFGRANLPELRKRTGYVAPWVFKRISPTITVKDVVASGKDASIGFCEIVDEELLLRVRKRLRFFGCEGLLERQFGELSSGQQLKVVLARALAHSPDVLILDEPFSLLDFGARLNIYGYLQKLCRGRKAPQVILVTHHREDIFEGMTHGLVMKDGKVFCQGERRSVLRTKVLSEAFRVPERMIRNYFV